MHITTKTTIVYLVKFEDGYYAEYQPHYEWSFTDNPLKAKLYKNKTKAWERSNGRGGVIEEFEFEETTILRPKSILDSDEVLAEIRKKRIENGTAYQ